MEDQSNDRQKPEAVEMTQREFEEHASDKKEVYDFLYTRNLF